MLNTTVVHNDSKTIVEAQKPQVQISIKQTAGYCKLICTKVGSETFKHLNCDPPYLDDRKEWAKASVPFYDDRKYSYVQRHKCYLTHGVHVVQVQQSGDTVWFEYYDVERPPKLIGEEYRLCDKPKEDTNV